MGVHVSPFESCPDPRVVVDASFVHVRLRGVSAPRGSNMGQLVCGNVSHQSLRGDCM